MVKVYVWGREYPHYVERLKAMGLPYNVALAYSKADTMTLSPKQQKKPLESSGFFTFNYTFGLDTCGGCGIIEAYRSKSGGSSDSLDSLNGLGSKEIP